MRFGSLGAPELLLILAIVIVLFGSTRLAGLGRELGNSIREFRKATRDGDADDRGRAADTVIGGPVVSSAGQGSAAAADPRPALAAGASSPPPDYRGS